jgi:hypothetical protein
VRQVSFTVFLSLLMATFVCIGFVLAIVMGRRGHSPFAWGVLGLVLGPIALLLALVAARDERSPSQVVAGGIPGSGPVDVLVGIDGSPESAAAATAALDLLGGRVGRLTLLAVTDIDDSVAGSQEQAHLRRVLEGQAEAVRAWLRDHPCQSSPSRRLSPSWCCGRVSRPQPWTEWPPRMATACWWSGPGEPAYPTFCLAASRPGWPPGPACRCW